MKKAFIATLAILSSLVITPNTQAENSITLEIAVPPAIAFETGIVTNNKTYMAGKLQFTSGSVIGGEITWTTASSNATKHWWGGGLGFTNDRNGDYINTSEGNKYFSLNYKYYANGISAKGTHFNASVRAYGDLALPAIGFGHNF